MGARAISESNNGFKQPAAAGGTRPDFLVGSTHRARACFLEADTSVAEVQCAQALADARRLCSASPTNQLQWRAEPVVGDLDSGRLIETGRRTGTRVASTAPSFETDPRLIRNQSASTAALITIVRRRQRETPTIPTLPDLTELDSACNVHVSITSGTDSFTCGSSSSSACGSMQYGIDRAGAFNTVCVHAGGLSNASNCAVV